MANKISPSTEGHNSHIRIQNSISVMFGKPHVYKNFWFGPGDLRLPTILFGYMPISDSEDTTLNRVMGLFEVLVKHYPVHSLDFSADPTDAIYYEVR
jgi:hypothetical protein